MEEIKRDVEYLRRIVERFDSALDNLQKVVHSIDNMTVVQTEKLRAQEEDTHIIHQRINDMKLKFKDEQHIIVDQKIHNIKQDIMRDFGDEFKLFRKENSDQHKEVKERLEQIEKDVQRWRLIFSGVAASVLFAVSILQIDGIFDIIK